MSEEKRYVHVSGKEVPYFLKLNLHQKNIILRVKNDSIYVSAPDFAAIEDIEMMIRQHYPKIARAQLGFELNQKYDLFSPNPWVKLFDQKVRIHLREDNIHTKMEPDGIVMKNYHDEKLQLEKLYTFLGRYYHNWFVNRTMDWAFKMNQKTFQHLTVKVMKGKWGACYSQTQKLIFNTKLLHFAPEIIDSVIIHELAHLDHPNHSARFWNEVKTYCPNYQTYDKILNAAGI